MHECKPGDTPIVKGNNFNLNQYPKEKKIKKIRCASAVGNLMYA